MTSQIKAGIIVQKGDIKMAKKKDKGPKLIDIICRQLQESNNFETVAKGEFDDDSGSWIDCYHIAGPNSNGKRYCKHLSFNGEGTVLEDVQVWEEQMTWDDDRSKQLK